MEDGRGQTTKYKFEQKYLSEKESFLGVEATTDPQQSAFDKYQELLKQYEKDLAEIKAKEKDIPVDDVLTEEYHNQVINSYQEEEQIMEKKLGSRFLT